MPKLGDPLVYDLLEVSTSLAKTRDRTNLRKAAMRRGVSSSYYAVFRALCFVCARIHETPLITVHRRSSFGRTKLYD